MKAIKLTGYLSNEGCSRDEVHTTLEVSLPYEHTVSVTVKGDFNEVQPFFSKTVDVICTINDQAELETTPEKISLAGAFSPRVDDGAIRLHLRSDAAMLESLRGQISDKYQADVDDWISDMNRAADLLDHAAAQ